jgi:Xaa-Pro dipeptidase
LTGTRPNYTARREALVSTLASFGHAAAAIVPGPNFYYFTGMSFHLMERPTILVVTAEGGLCAIIPEVERSLWSRSVPEADTIFWQDSSGFAGAFQMLFSSLRGSIAVEGLRMRVREFRAIAEANPALALTDGQDLIGTPRLTKSNDEIAIVRQAVAISERALERTISETALGMSEIALKQKLVLALMEEGADALAFDPIVLFGAAAADCHGHSEGTRTLRAGDAVLIDFGAAYGGYNADITRTFFARYAAEEDRQLYAAVLAANETGRRLARPGLTASELDASVTAVMAEAGFADHIVHKTGHGLGIDVHEAPQIMMGNDIPLAPGMLFTIEPGLYVPSRIGVRLEDNVLIGASASESLTGYSRDLTLIA